MKGNNTIFVMTKLFLSILILFIVSACSFVDDFKGDDTNKLVGTKWYNSSTKEYLLFTDQDLIEDGGYGFNRGYDVTNNLKLYNYYPNSRKFFDRLDSHICVNITSYVDDIIYNYAIYSYTSSMRIFQYEGGKFYFSKKILYFEFSTKNNDGVIIHGFQSFNKVQ